MAQVFWQARGGVGNGLGMLNQSLLANVSTFPFEPAIIRTIGDFVGTLETTGAPYQQSIARPIGGPFTAAQVPISLDRFEIRPGDVEPYTGGQRVEWDGGDQFRDPSISLWTPGTEMWISYWMAVMTSPIDNMVGLNDFNIVGQWHQTPDTGSVEANPMVSCGLSNSDLLPNGNAPPGGFGATLVATLVTNAPTTASNVLNFASVPGSINASQLAIDATNPGSIPVGTSVASTTTTTVTVSRTLTVAAGDTIQFIFPAGVRCTPSYFFSTADPMTSNPPGNDLLTTGERISSGLDNLALNTIHYFVHNFKTDPTGATGFWQMYFNGQTLTRYNGQLGYASDTGSYWKFGIYQDAGGTQEQGSATVVWYGNMEFMPASQGTLLSRVATPLAAPSFTQLMNL